jgi:hypothetical protein
MADSYQVVFQQLSQLMSPYVGRLRCTENTDTRLSVDTDHVVASGKPLWFGGVEIKKNYVSYHLMPVYTSPELLKDVSAELRARMQGKSCFNFTRLEPHIAAELAKLTDAAFEHYRTQGYVK